jgi:hypothetical protein
VLAWGPFSFLDQRVDEMVERGAAVLAGAPSIMAFKNSWRDDEIAHHRKQARESLEAALNEEQP